VARGPWRWEPSLPERFERRDLDQPACDEDQALVAQLRAEVVAARRRRSPDQLALEDAAERTEFIERHKLIYRVGSVVEHYGKGRVGRALERHTAGREQVAPPPYPTTLQEQYSRYFTLARRQRWEQPPRWADDTVALVVVGPGDATATVNSFNVQRRQTDVVVEIDAAQLASTLISLGSRRPAPRWLMVLNAGDVMTPDAVSQLIHFAGDGDFAYADQDHLDGDGRHVEAWLKGDELGVLGPLSYFAPGEAAIFRRSALVDLDESMGTAVLHDAVLRLVERGSVGVHIPSTFISRPLGAPSYARGDDLARATSAALHRRGWGGGAVAGAREGTVQWRPGDPATWPSVQIVIPTRDRLDLLEPCVRSLETNTDYPAMTITIVDNGSVEPATLNYLDKTSHRVVRDPRPFCFPREVNLGAAAGDEEYVLLLNNDTVALDPEWLKDLVRVGELPTFGIVGAVLVGDSGSINHAGITVADAPCQFSYPDSVAGDDPTWRVTRDVLAVLGACQLVRRDIWNELGGHDETFEIECSDVDICLRARDLGYRTAIVGTSPVLHHEKVSRGELREDRDGPTFAYRWGLDDGFVDRLSTPVLTYLPGPRFRLVDFD
jgi:GT2 family glycosyltransferase